MHYVGDQIVGVRRKTDGVVDSGRIRALMVEAERARIYLAGVTELLRYELRRISVNGMRSHD